MKTYTIDDLITMCDKARQSFIHPFTKDIIIPAGKKDMIFKYDKIAGLYR